MGLFIALFIIVIGSILFVEIASIIFEDKQ